MRLMTKLLVFLCCFFAACGKNTPLYRGNPAITDSFLPDDSTEITDPDTDLGFDPTPITSPTPTGELKKPLCELLADKYNITVGVNIQEVTLTLVIPSRSGIVTQRYIANVALADEVDSLTLVPPVGTTVYEGRVFNENNDVYICKSQPITRVNPVASPSPLPPTPPPPVPSPSKSPTPTPTPPPPPPPPPVMKMPGSISITFQANGGTYVSTGPANSGAGTLTASYNTIYYLNGTPVLMTLTGTLVNSSNNLNFSTVVPSFGVTCSGSASVSGSGFNFRGNFTCQGGGSVATSAVTIR